MAALLGQDLVFDVNGGRPCILEGPNHVHHVQRLAIAGISIYEQRQSGRPGDLTDEETHIVDGDDAQIGQPHRCRHGGAGQVKRLEACIARLH